MNENEDRLLKLPEVCRIVGISRMTVYLRMDDAGFPRPLDIGGNSVRWRESDVRAWVNALPLKVRAA